TGLIKLWAIKHRLRSILESRKQRRSTKNWPGSRSVVVAIVVYRASWSEIFSTIRGNQKGCRFAAVFLDEFKKAYGNLSERSTNHASASAHLSDEFPAGYSLTRCSPAELISASPAGTDDVSAGPSQGIL